MLISIVSGYHARDVRDLHPFVLDLPHATVQNNTRGQPLMALQVTEFPNSGICIGAAFGHAVADGRSFHHFMKSWASIFRSAGNSAPAMPVLDRGVVQEKRPLWAFVSFLKPVVELHGAEPQRASIFVVACALVWTSLVKTQKLSLSSSLNHHQDDEFYYFGFVGDCRNRPELAIPSAYFGNCLAMCITRLMGSELVGENGVFAATKATGNRVEQFKNGALKGAENWITNWIEISETGRLSTVAGSPKLRDYDIDFGWGKPK
ncbi:Detected protein of unknown function [Hibiscus syriacus]|uniref:HXXXD-type acyl-transferase family protein n=1 Tax=Hibiscus syriacus TaxID=106335 RepID=A0A6A2WTH8_HIBSY|nr:Detected protein of unknown function [Hibiscus syriacus]